MKISGYISIGNLKYVDLCCFILDGKSVFNCIGLDCYMNDYVAGIQFFNFLTNAKYIF
jgi:hypothetical protein